MSDGKSGVPEPKGQAYPVAATIVGGVREKTLGLACAGAFIGGLENPPALWEQTERSRESISIVPSESGALPKILWIFRRGEILQRFVSYLLNRSLWLDESMLALNILGRVSSNF